MNKLEMKKAFRALTTAAVLLFDAWLDEAAEAKPAEKQASPARAVEEDAPPTGAKRGRKPKNENKPAPAAVEEEDEEETDVISASDLKNEPEAGDEDDFGDLLDDEEEEAEEEITEQVLRSKLVDFAKAKSKDEAYKVLGKFGAKKVQDLKPSQYGKVHSALEAAM